MCSKNPPLSQERQTLNFSQQFEQLEYSLVGISKFPTPLVGSPTKAFFMEIFMWPQGLGYMPIS